MCLCPEISLFWSRFTPGQQTQLVCKIPPLAHTLAPGLSLELQLASCWGEAAEENLFLILSFQTPPLLANTRDLGWTDV